MKLLSWLYLLWLNFAYYILFCRFLKNRPQTDFYEEKRIPTKRSESQEHILTHPDLSVPAYVQKLKDYDVISFDIFDTLILRPVSQPADIFYLVGEKLGIPDFKNIRVWAEAETRRRCRERNGHMEVTLEEIWKQLSMEVGCSAEHGMMLEEQAEIALCYGNPFMLEVWRQLKDMGKPLILISDMYLSRKTMECILEQNGFTGAQKLYISCEYKRNKATGSLFQLVKEEFGKKTVIHVGDHPHSDADMAKRNGFAICPYPNINRKLAMYRPFDMSCLVGSAYRGVISNHLYNGKSAYSMEYEYGYIYGGIFVLGYCSFIHDYYQKHHIDKLLFLSRDGDILKQAYDFLYPEDQTSYVYWSRKAAAKLMAEEDRHDYFRRFIYHKVNQGYTIREILHSMDLDILSAQVHEWSDGLKTEDELASENATALRRFIETKWEQVRMVYGPQQKAAGQYYADVLHGCNQVAAIDIGWAGSGALALSHLAEQVWNIPCRITGIIAGTNTIHNAEPDASEPFLQSGRLEAYLYSQSHNRDLWKKHDSNKDYNVFWELLLSSPMPKFEGFQINPDGSVKLNFGAYDKNLRGIREIQRGILDFVAHYYCSFQAFPYMLRISGRDAYAPMLVAASHKEKYLRAMEKRFQFEINVD